ncbi:hypothetical protein, partial [Acinetobacter baumannii]|uniref:hypothetical protein n=1 Tax=Acinetobacter baumannii TaxID=470 RepID=UPI000C4CA42C
KISRGKIWAFPQKGEKPRVLKPRGLKRGPWGFKKPQKFSRGKIFPGKNFGAPFPKKRGKNPGF